MTCECCGAPTVTSFYPYGDYCEPCGTDITHPTGYSHCFVTDGREHKCAQPADWDVRDHETPAERRDREWDEMRELEGP